MVNKQRHRQDQFAYEELVQCFVNNSKSLGVDFPTDFYLYDIKLIYGLKSEDPDIILEQKFFQANSTLGQAATNITLGDIYDPKIVPQAELIKWATTLSQWQKDDLPLRMQVYRDILYSTEFDKPLVLYIHCECGCDRTGEIFASYVMKYQGWSFNKSMEWDYAVAGRKIMPNHQFAAQWYCYYLKYVENQTIECTSPTWYMEKDNTQLEEEQQYPYQEPKIKLTSRK
eukprot:gene2885-3586_t